MADISVVGAGSWGTALSIVLADNGHQVTVWSILEDEVEMLNTKREHKDKLPGVKIPEEILFTTDLGETVRDKDMVVLAVPSPYIRSTARNMSPFVSKGQLIVIVSKGIEESSLKILSEVAEEEIPQAQIAVMSGPSHAEEVSRRLPTTVVAGARTRAAADQVQSFFMNQVFRVYTSPDMLGIELGGALKNVIALAAGMADGLGFGDNTKAALITRGINEISKLAIRMGAKAETINGLSGIGDLIVTCASRHSRNRKAGMLIGQGCTMKEAMDKVQMVVEGVYSAKAAKKLSEKYDVNMPIITEVNQVLFEEKPVKLAVSELMLRDRKKEHEDLSWNEADTENTLQPGEKAEIRVKYFLENMPKLTYVDGKSDWIDLRSSETISLKAGEFRLIPLGVAMKLPEGYEAHVVPRSSTFKNFGLIQTNSMGVIDNSYCGDEDMWMVPMVATRDVVIHRYDRICQFRIERNQPELVFRETDSLGGNSRGGFGSTGVK